MCEHLRGSEDGKFITSYRHCYGLKVLDILYFFCSSKKCIFGNVQSSQWKAIKWHAHTHTNNNNEKKMRIFISRHTWMVLNFLLFVLFVFRLYKVTLVSGQQFHFWFLSLCVFVCLCVQNVTLWIQRASLICNELREIWIDFVIFVFAKWKNHWFYFSNLNQKRLYIE